MKDKSFITASELAETYGFWDMVKTESDCVARLMEMYAALVR